MRTPTCRGSRSPDGFGILGGATPPSNIVQMHGAERMERLKRAVAGRWTSPRRLAIIGTVAAVLSAVGPWVFSASSPSNVSNGVIVGASAQVGNVVNQGTATVAPPADGHGGNGGSAVLNNISGTAVVTGSGGQGGPPDAGRGGDGGGAIVNGGFSGIVCSGNGGDAGQANGKGGRGGDNPCWEAILKSLPPEVRSQIPPNAGRGGDSVVAGREASKSIH
jgi:hypothetical protein